MHLTASTKHALVTALSLLLMIVSVPSISHAEIYKWVDGNGTTHYTQKKPKTSQAEEVDIAPSTEQSTSGYEAYLKNKEDQRKQKIEAELHQADEAPIEPEKSPSLSRARVDESDASKCALARDIINGSVRRLSSPTDATDIATAENDIKLFCQ